MTKTVRIENADTTSYKVRVRAQYKDPVTGEWKDAGPEEQVFNLDYPTFLATASIHSNKRLIVEEV